MPPVAPKPPVVTPPPPCQHHTQQSQEHKIVLFYFLLNWKIYAIFWERHILSNPPTLRIGAKTTEPEDPKHFPLFQEFVPEFVQRYWPPQISKCRWPIDSGRWALAHVVRFFFGCLISKIRFPFFPGLPGTWTSCITSLAFLFCVLCPGYFLVGTNLFFCFARPIGLDTNGFLLV